MNINIREQLVDLFIYNISNIDKFDIKHSQMVELTHFGFLILQILKMPNIKFRDQVLLERLLSKIHTNLYTYELVQYFSSFYNLPKKVYSKNDYLLVFDISHSNLLIDIFRLRIKLYAINGNSEDIYFFTRGLSGLLRGILNMKRHFKDSSNLSGAYYTLLNYAQTIAEYKMSGIILNEVNLGPLVIAIVKCINLYKPLLKTTFKEKFQLQCFEMHVCNLMNDAFNTNFKIDFVSFENVLSKKLTLNNIWMFYNLIGSNQIYADLFNDELSRNPTYEYGNYKDKTVLIIDYIKANPEVEFDIEIPIFEHPVERNWFNMDEYFRNYMRSSNISITNEDRKLVFEMNDQQLRLTVSKIIDNIDKHKIMREASKPHGPQEISDMELPIFKNNKYYYMCLPFKSGVEKSGKIGVDVMYQIVRPFILLGDSAIVVFISPRDGSEIFFNEIKHMTTNPLFKIETLMGDTLIRLLKFNGAI